MLCFQCRGFWQAKVKAAEKTEQDIDAARLEYVPVAVRAQILFFCVSDLSNVDPMYQYSLEWFLGIFLSGIANSRSAGSQQDYTPNYMCEDNKITRTRCEQCYGSTFFLDMFHTDTVEERIWNINEYFTFSLYGNICRSLFEKHKLMFAFLLCARIMMNDKKIDMVSNGKKGICHLL